MSEPTVSYPLTQVLARIEKDIAGLKEDVHKIQLSQAGMAAGDVAEAAIAAAGRAKAAVYWAAGSFGVGLTGVIVALIIR